MFAYFFLLFGFYHIFFVRQTEQGSKTANQQLDSLHSSQGEIVKGIATLIQGDTVANELRKGIDEKLQISNEQQDKVYNETAALSQNSAAALELKSKTISNIEEIMGAQNDLLNEIQLLTKTNNKAIPAAERLKFEDAVQSLLEEIKASCSTPMRL